MIAALAASIALLQAVHDQTAASTTYAESWLLYTTGPVGNCTTFAEKSYQALEAQGVDAQVWVVDLPYGGQQHAVVIVGDRVIDSLHKGLTKRSDYFLAYRVQ